MQNYNQIPRIIKCPVCSSHSSKCLYEVNSSQAAQHFVLKEKEYERFLKLVFHIEQLWGKNTCEVVQCDTCGFCFSDPYVSGDELFYSLAYSRNGYPKWKWEFQQTYDILKKSTEINVRLLEIGAGDGAFIKKITDSVSKNNILCTEFSEYGRHKIELFGVKCLNEDVRNLSEVELKGSFNVVCMFQVLEHMDKLEELFRKLNWLMKSGGSLYIAVPNHLRIEFNELNGALFDMPPNHIGRWNKKCFEVIGQKNGFYINNYKTEETRFIAMAKEFAIYRFLRKSQISHSFENKIQKIKNHYLLKMIQIIGVGANLILAIPAIFKMNYRMGGSQWVQLIKEKE